MTQNQRSKYMQEVSGYSDWPGDSKFFLQFLLDEHAEGKIETSKAMDMFFILVPEVEEIEKKYDIAPPKEVRCFKSYVTGNQENNLEKFKECAAPKKIEVQNIQDPDDPSAKMVIGPYSYDKMSSSLSNVGDFDKDGFGDFAIGISNAYAEGRESGEIHVLFGYNDLNVNTIDLSLGGDNKARVLRIIGASSHDAVGQVVASEGDFNKDGINDLVFSAPQYLDPRTGKRPGAVYIILGKKEKITKIDLKDFVDSKSGFIIVGPSNKKFFGHEVAFIGDYDGDGFDDLAVSAIFDENRQGEVYIIKGRKFASNPLIEIDDSSSQVVKITSNIDGGFFGFSISYVGDVNKDGLGDFAVSSPFENADGIDNAGVVRIFTGAREIKRSLSLADSYKIIKGDQERALFGYKIAFLGDLINNDSYMGVGSPRYSFEDRDYAGAVFLINLAELKKDNNFNMQNSIFVKGPEAHSFLGTAMDKAGNFSAKNAKDIVIATHLLSSGGLINNGAVFILYSNSIKQNSNIDLRDSVEKGQGAILKGNINEGFAGVNVASCLDFDGDGMTDIIFSVPGESYKQRELCGHAYIVLGYELDI